MDSDEEERLRQWKQHLASQRNGGDDSDNPREGSSGEEHDHHKRQHEISHLPAARIGSSAGGTSARKKQSNDSLRDSLVENVPADKESIDWASALMPQLRELKEENMALRNKAAAHEKEIRQLRLEQQTMGVDISSADGPRLGGDLKDSKIVELAKKNRTLTVQSPKHCFNCSFRF